MSQESGNRKPTTKNEFQDLMIKDFVPADERDCGNVF